MDISKIFKSRTRKELFRLYFTNPDSEYYLRELERILDTPVSMIRNELVNLEKDGMFISKKKGNSIYYSLNKGYPLFDELKSIVFKTVGIQGLLKEVFKKVKGIEVAFIFFSFSQKNKYFRVLKKVNYKRIFFFGFLFKLCSFKYAVIYFSF